MGSMESTVVATAMPTIVGQLGGLSIYGWAFSIFVLASSAGMPVAGKLSDIFGRRVVYAGSMGLFLLASLLCGIAPNMISLILFRGLQGLGAAGLLPLALVMIGDMFRFEERARVQGLFSMVWGLSSIVGPLLGGFLVDRVGWPSVFLINIPFGILSGWMVWHYWEDRHAIATGKPHIDYGGAALVTVTAVLMLLGLIDITRWEGSVAVAVAIALALYTWRFEQRSPDPVLPVPLFQWRLFTIAVLHGAVVGWMLNGVTAFLPLYVQEIQKKSATEAGAVLSPMLLGWVLFSPIATKWMMRAGYRVPAIAGMVGVVAGSGLLVTLHPGSSKFLLLGSMFVLGSGFGLTVPSLLIAVQTSVERRWMGAATSMIQFARSIGGALGVGVMGAILNLRMKSHGMGAALETVFIAASVVTLLGLGLAIAAPKLSAAELSALQNHTLAPAVE